MMTPEEFGQKIKEKYPQYKDMDDAELTRRILNKYPQYEAQVAEPTKLQQAGQVFTQGLESAQQALQGGGEAEGLETSGARGAIAGREVVRGTFGAGFSLLPEGVQTKIGDVASGVGSFLQRNVIDPIASSGRLPFKSIGELEAGSYIEGVAPINLKELSPSYAATEEALATMSAIGEVADVPLAIEGATRAGLRTGAAAMDVGREVLDKTLRATDNIAEKATPQSVRTLLRMNKPETQAQAVAQLVDSYESGLVAGRKSVNNRLEKLAAAETFGDVRVTKDDLIKNLAREGYIPRIEDQLAKFDEVVDDISNRQALIGQQIDRELAPYANRIEAQTSLERMRAEAEAVLRQSPQVGAGLTSSIKELNRMFASFAEKYGDKLDPVAVNNVRKEMNRVTKAYKDEDLFKLDTAEAVGRVARKRLDDIVPEEKVRQLNQEWARLNQIAETAKILNNEVVEVGLIGRKLGSYVGTVGASLAGLSIAGPGGLVVASIAAQLGSDALATLLRNRKFSPELRSRIINELRADPATAERVIREASPENKAFLRNVIIGGSVVAGAEMLGDDGNGVLVGGAALMAGKSKPGAIINKIDAQRAEIKAELYLLKQKGAPATEISRLQKTDDELRRYRNEVVAAERKNAKKTEAATPGTTDLLAEARKYDSAEEFVKAQGTPVFHATDSNSFDPKDFNPKAAAKGEGFFNPLGAGLYTSTNKDFVRRFGSNTMELVLPKDAKIKNVSIDSWEKDFSSISRRSIKNLGIKYNDLTFDEKLEINRLVPNSPIESANDFEVILRDIAERLGKDGSVQGAIQKSVMEQYKNYDVIRYIDTDYAFAADEIVVKNPSILKTRTQLEDIWKQANQK